MFHDENPMKCGLSRWKINIIQNDDDKGMNFLHDLPIPSTIDSFDKLLDLAQITIRDEFRMNSLDKTATFSANQISDEFRMNSANKVTNSKANQISDEFRMNPSTKLANSSSNTIGMD